MSNEKVLYESIKRKGIVPIEILDKMSEVEMLEHIILYTTIGEIWYPGIKS